MTQPRVFSGVQPTGNLHLGNYLGAIRHWVDMQDAGGHDCMFCIVDLHAITVPQDPEHLRNSIRETAAAYIACGIDPAKSIIFHQSTVPGHAELAWVLGCHTPLGWLNRMTQFKEKAGKHKENASLGLYGYPVLMAADILLYKTTHVPVGEDQKQHLELARDIAGAFNRHYETEFFPLPEPLILGEATRVMSLRDGTKKMSKSDESEFSRISLTDTPEVIADKFRRAKSDMVVGLDEDLENRPEALNLATIYAALEGIEVKKIRERFALAGFSEFKGALAELATQKLSPITERMRELMARPQDIDAILADGAKRANAIARETMEEVKEMVGFLRV